MKRCISVIALIALVLSAFGCGSNSAYVEYAEKKLDGITYIVPKTWSASETGATKYYYPDNSNHDVFLMIQSSQVTANQIESETSFEPIFDNYVNSLANSFNNPKINSKSVEKYGSNLYRGNVDIVAESEGKSRHILSSAIVDNSTGTFFGIGFTSPDKISNENLEIFKYVVSQVILKWSPQMPPQSQQQAPVKDTVLSDISALIKEKNAFDVGSYIKGDVPAGEYAFVKFAGSGSYYSEEDGAGNIIDNENFYSFGYVKVHAAGNLETRGALIRIEALEKLGVRGAKELYEKLNKVSDWSESGYYKVGVDIDPGTYTLESMGQGYYAIKSGPVGSSNIIKNNNFSGKNSVNLKNGQYLELSRAKIYKAG